MVYSGVVETRCGPEGAVSEEGFAAFVDDHGERLRRVLVAAYGVEVGNDVCAEAHAYAWEHWDEVRELDNPVGYLYRVAQSSARRHWRWSRPVALPVERPAEDRTPRPDLGAALTGLTENQRMCVILVHVYDWSYQQTADALDLPLSSVRNHVHRGLKVLRRHLEDGDD